VGVERRFTLNGFTVNGSSLPLLRPETCLHAVPRLEQEEASAPGKRRHPSTGSGQEPPHSTMLRLIQMAMKGSPIHHATKMGRLSGKRTGTSIVPPSTTTLPYSFL